MLWVTITAPAPAKTPFRVSINSAFCARSIPLSNQTPAASAVRRKTKSLDELE